MSDYPPTAGPSAHRLREALGAPRESVAYAHDAQFHATVELVCQLLDVIDGITDADVARRITDEFARLLSTEHTAQAHQRIRETDEQIMQARLFGREARSWTSAEGQLTRTRQLSPAAEAMTGYHGPRSITPGHKFGPECPNYPYGCRLCIPAHDITVHEHPHEHLGIRHVHGHRHPVPPLSVVRFPQPHPEKYMEQLRESMAGLLPEGTYEVLPQGTFETIPYQDMIENLASINEILAELAAREADDVEFSRLTRNVLRRHSWRLGMLFQGEMGDPDEPAVPRSVPGTSVHPHAAGEPGPAPEPAGRDEGGSEHPAGPGT